MHGAADPVPSESIVDGVAQAVRLVHYRMADVPDRGPGADLIDPRPHHGFRVADQLQILRTRSADDEGDTGVGHPALDLDGEIQGDQVTGLEHARSEEHTSELQSRGHLVCRLLLAKKK